MSDSWDRPPPRDPGDSRPAEDVRERDAPDREADRWSSRDPWSASSSPDSSGWGAWPPAPPPPEGEFPDDAELPVHDPWAESWTTDEPEAPSADAVVESHREPDRAPDREAWTPYEPARAEPWRPSDDAWSSGGLIDEASAPAPEWTPAPAVEPEQPAEAAPAGPPMPAPPDGIEPAVFVDEIAPESEPEPEPAPPAPTPIFAPEAEFERQPWPEPSPPPPEPLFPAPEPSPPEPEPEPEPLIPAPEPEREPEQSPGPEPEPEPAVAVPEPGPAWPERADSTQVFPSSWTPPAPTEPAEPDRSRDLDPVVGRIKVSLAEAEADAEAEERPSTAEQAVPWLIGVILLLAGMVIVLLALIFAGDASLGGGGAAPSDSTLAVIPSLEASPSAEPTATPTAAPTQSPVASAEATPSASPGPVFGPLEMVYQGRSAALAPIYLLQRDFTKVEDTQEILAQDPALDVRRFAWAPDGSVGAGLLADVLVSVEPGKEKRRLADGISTITFGDDASTVYAVRVTQDGENDVATVLAVDFASADENELAAASYPRPDIGEEDALAEAQFSDEGGTVRLYWVEDGTLRLWVLGAGTWRIDPTNGDVEELAQDAIPVLWAPDGDRRITTAFADGSSTIVLLDDAEEEVARVSIDGRVSHLRWAPDGTQVVFTLGRSAAGGGVLQDLFLWDLNDTAPKQLTPTGAAFGAEWLGAQALWRD